LRIRHGLDLAAQNDFFRLNTDLLADFARDEVIVAGEDLDRDTVLAQNGDGLGSGVLGRIEECEITGEN